MSDKNEKSRLTVIVPVLARLRWRRCLAPSIGHRILETYGNTQCRIRQAASVDFCIKNIFSRILPIFYALAFEKSILRSRLNKPHPTHTGSSSGLTRGSRPHGKQQKNVHEFNCLHRLDARVKPEHDAGGGVEWAARKHDRWLNRTAVGLTEVAGAGFVSSLLRSPPSAVRYRHPPDRDRRSGRRKSRRDRG